jgi:hypothetical protein
VSLSSVDGYGTTPPRWVTHHLLAAGGSEVLPARVRRTAWGSVDSYLAHRIADGTFTALHALVPDLCNGGDVDLANGGTFTATIG